MKIGQSTTQFQQCDAVSAFRDGRRQYDFESGDVIIGTRHDPLKRIIDDALSEASKQADNIIKLVPTTIQGKILSVLNDATRMLTQAEIRFAIHEKFELEVAPDAVSSSLWWLSVDRGIIERAGAPRFYRYKLPGKEFSEKKQSVAV